MHPRADDRDGLPGSGDSGRRLGGDWCRGNRDDRRNRDAASQERERAHRLPSVTMGTNPSSKSVRQRCAGSSRSKRITPSIHTFSARA
jgi:hypothetical protein